MHSENFTYKSTMFNYYKFQIIKTSVNIILSMLYEGYSVIMFSIFDVEDKVKREIINIKKIQKRYQSTGCRLVNRYIF